MSNLKFIAGLLGMVLGFRYCVCLMDHSFFNFISFLQVTIFSILISVIAFTLICLYKIADENFQCIRVCQAIQVELIQLALIHRRFWLLLEQLVVPLSFGIWRRLRVRFLLCSLS